jgi:hypothetical protein
MLLFVFLILSDHVPCKITCCILRCWHGYICAVKVLDKRIISFNLHKKLD